MIIDRRKLQLSTNISVKRFLDRVKRIALQDKQLNLDGEPTAKKVNLNQPGFYFDHNTGIHNFITPGNDKWMRGDIIDFDWWEWIMQMLSGHGDDEADGTDPGPQPGKDGDGVDGFSWDEVDQIYVDTIFDTLELPNLTKKSLESEEKEIVRSGYSTSGSNIDFMRTFINSVGRRMALKPELEKELEILKANKSSKEKIKELENRIKSIAFIDDIDVRYRRFEEKITPSKRMVMFLIMDVSGSMGQEEKNLAKLFSKLLVTFLAKQYDKCVIEYITFTDSPEHVDYQEFFYGKRSGGTTLYPALDMAKELIETKYSNDWNIYTTIFTDSGIDREDTNMSINRIKDLLTLHQFLIYTHIHMNDIKVYEYIAESFSKNPAFGSCVVDDDRDVIDEFIKMFSKKK